MGIRRHHRGRSLAAFGVGLAVLAVACGDDGDDAASATTASTAATGTSAGGGADLHEYCDASLTAAVLQPEIDFEALTPEQQGEAAKTFATEELRPVADQILANAPEELADEYEILDANLTTLEETGDFMVFQSPEFLEADQTIHEFDVENCGWERVDVEGQEYAFLGVPATVPAGPASFELDNTGKEVHELALLRFNDGVTDTHQEVLALPEEQAFEKLTFISQGMAAPGEQGYALADLEAGRYAMVCFIPKGTTSLEQQVEGEPHAVLGMVAEFSVE